MQGLTEEEAVARLTGHVRLRTLVVLRWLAVAGQSFAVIFVHLSLGFPLPLGLCLAAIAASAWLNIFASLRYPAQRMLGDKEAAFYLAYDILQLACLLYLTGGLKNPFSLLFLAPVTISASVLGLRATLALGGLALACITFLALFHFPLPWSPGETPVLPPMYLGGIWAALVLGLGFTAIYAWRIASERTRMSTALAATQLVLAREQKLSALGGLAAAAAHELGTPLATIQLVAKEMALEFDKEFDKTHPLAEDADLLVSQAERCRDILARLSLRGEEGDIVHDTMNLESLLSEAVEPYRALGADICVRIAPPATAEPITLMRSPEILYGLQNIIENAADFAKKRVDINAEINGAGLKIIVSDDGPGFAQEVLARLGEPYITTRAAAHGPRRPGAAAPHEGMGLGFFIAKTLLERTGGEVAFANRLGPDRDRPSGARVSVFWAAAAVDALAGRP